MRKLLIVFLFLKFVTTANAQSFGGLYTSSYWTEKDVQKDIDKEIKKGKNNKTIPAYYKDKMNDTLTYVIQHNVDGFTLKLTFNISDFENIYCNFQQYTFDCTPCSQKHLAEFIKNYHFRQKTENIYVSNYTFHTEMTVNYKSSNKDCLVITFKYLELEKKDYKELYKSLKKKTTA